MGTRPTGDVTRAINSQPACMTSEHVVQQTIDQQHGTALKSVVCICRQTVSVTVSRPTSTAFIVYQVGHKHVMNHSTLSDEQCAQQSTTVLQPGWYL